MRYLRYVLLLASLAGCLFILGSMKVHPNLTGYDVLIGLLAAAVPALNFLYLLEHPPKDESTTSRIGRMFSMWLTAKENELRDRSTPRRED